MAGISAILTAAGESTRMGRPKPLLPWRGVTLVEYQVECLVEAGATEVVVVLGHMADSVAPYVRGPGVRHVINLDYRQGKTTSIRTGLRAVGPDGDSILLMAIDQPRTPKIITTLIQSHVEQDALITSPSFQGHRGHPLIFSARLRGELEGISEREQGVREVFEKQRGQVNLVEFDDPMVRLDLNTLDEYEEAKARLGA